MSDPYTEVEVATNVRALPDKPLLAPWYRRAEAGDALALDYAHRAVVLEGRAVRALLPALLPLLDGTRTVDEIVACIGEPVRPAVENVLELLGSRGLLTGPASLRRRGRAPRSPAGRA